MIHINLDNEEQYLEIVEKELKKANLNIEPCLKFNYLNWEFTRTSKHWKVQTIPKHGLTKEQGIKLHTSPFPYEYFDEDKSTIYGHYIRLGGHAACPNPNYKDGLWLEEDKCTLYHIDNQCAFNFFVKFLRNILD